MHAGLLAPVTAIVIMTVRSIIPFVKFIPDCCQNYTELHPHSLERQINLLSAVL